jgi:1,4-dihydroxy-6-naphthoate synthase
MYGNPGNPGLQPAVLIHEGQITYERHGLRKIMDLGEWWFEQTKLPTPLGLDVVKTSLGMDVATEVKRAQEQ